MDKFVSGQNACCRHIVALRKSILNDRDSAEVGQFYTEHTSFVWQIGSQNIQRVQSVTSEERVANKKLVERCNYSRWCSVCRSQQVVTLLSLSVRLSRSSALGMERSEFKWPYNEHVAPHDTRSFAMCADLTTMSVFYSRKSNRNSADLTMYRLLASHPFRLFFVQPILFLKREKTGRSGVPCPCLFLPSAIKSLWDGNKGKWSPLRINRVTLPLELTTFSLPFLFFATTLAASLRTTIDSHLSSLDRTLLADHWKEDQGYKVCPWSYRDKTIIRIARTTVSFIMLLYLTGRPHFVKCRNNDALS